VKREAQLRIALALPSSGRSLHGPGYMVSENQNLRAFCRGFDEFAWRSSSCPLAALSAVLSFGATGDRWAKGLTASALAATSCASASSQNCKSRLAGWPAASHI